MKPKKKNPASPAPAAPSPSLWDGVFSSLPLWTLSLTLFLAPFFPDEKLNRLKLMAFGAGFILTAALWAFAKTRGARWTLYRTGLDIYMGLYLAAALLYYRASQNPAVAVSELQRMIFSVGAFVLAVQVTAGRGVPELKKTLFAAWTAGFALISAYGLLQKTGGAGVLMVPKMDRVFATFGNPIFFAAFLVATIPVVLALCIEARSSLARLAYSLSLALGTAALFCTETRAAFLALPFSLLSGYILLEYSRDWPWMRRLWDRKKIWAGAAVLFLAAHFVLGTASGRYARFAERVGTAVGASRIGHTRQTHTVIWKDVVRMWRAHPWFGTGFGTFYMEFPAYASDELKRYFPPRERIINDAHNEYLQILAETGTVGFLIFAALIFVFYAGALKPFLFPAAGTEASVSSPVLYAGLLSGVTALLVQNIFSVDMRFIVSSIYVFFAMGLVQAFRARPVDLGWGASGVSRWLKSAWVLFFLFAGGLIGWGTQPPGFYVLGVYRLSRGEQGLWRWQSTPGSGPGLLPALLRPYLAQNLLAQTPDFFDEKLLNAAQTISDLEKLTRDYPEQWKYWEKLGYACAKEIQTVSPDGSKRNDPAMAEKSVQAYVKAWQLNPKAEGPPNNLGNIYFTLNRRAEAIAWWLKAIEANPDKIDARLNLGLAYFYDGKVKESSLQFQEVLKRDPKNEKAIVMLKRMVE